MRLVLPGKPQPRFQGLTTGFWQSKRITAYVTGNSISILDGLHSILQTIYDDDQTPLQAIALDERTGNIATCTLQQCRIYRPRALDELDEDVWKWAFDSAFDISCSNEHASPPCLSWGSSSELLVAADGLSLFSINREPKCIWQSALPNPVATAGISHDSAFLASVSSHDRLPKIWRRLSYGQSDVRFDMTYLGHPDLVTGIRWRTPLHVDSSAGNVIYTFCLDNHVRIWVHSDGIDGQFWHLWGKIDICAPFQDGSFSQEEEVRLVWIIDGRDFTASVEKTVQHRMADDASTDDVALDHLVAVAHRNPEICVAIDKHGHLSAWAMKNVDTSSISSPEIFSIAQNTSHQFANLGGFAQPLDSDPAHLQALCYCDEESGRLHILVHSCDGRIGVFVSNIADLFDPTTNNQRLSLQTIWTGHSASIVKLVRNFSGQAIVSRTESGESIIWKHDLRDMGAYEKFTLGRSSVIPEHGLIQRVCVLRNGRFVVCLSQDAVSLWDCRLATATILFKLPIKISGEALCLIILPRPQDGTSTVAHVAAIMSDKAGIVWEVGMPPFTSASQEQSTINLREYCKFKLQVTESLTFVLPVDPAGSKPVVSGFLDVFAKDVAISYTNTGRVDFWTVRVDLKSQSVEWLSTCSTLTGLNNSALISGSSLKKAALVNCARVSITIWDIGGARLEYDHEYGPGDTINDLDWTSTPDLQSILAVGFQFRVVLLAQMRFDYVNRGPAWASIREVSIRELTPHPIGDSVWLGSGHLVVGAGNQLFIYDRDMSNETPAPFDSRVPHRKTDIFTTVQHLNGPLPLFHPQFLSQSVLAGKVDLVQHILVELHRMLKYHVPEDPVDSHLGIDTESIYTKANATKSEWRRTSKELIDSSLQMDDEEGFTEAVGSLINEKLQKTKLPQLSGQEQIQLADIIECAALVQRHRRSMDENGSRFMLFYRQTALLRRHPQEPHISWREVNWAFHSNSQDILVDFVIRQNNGGLLWEHARNSGLFMWISDSAALKEQFEIVARHEYAKSEAKDPVDCSIFYLALKKKAVLHGLWRMAGSNKEQAATQRLLANDFADPKWKTAALKNAYALLSKRRFQYAAAFFLLGDNLESAAEICLRQLKDVQLAIAVVRVYEGDEGPVLRKLLQGDVLGIAAQQGNRWLASWAFWMLGRRDMAVRALITPVFALLETPGSPDYKSRLFLTDDPALIVLYSQLRQRTVQTLRGASKVTPRTEWEFVLHCAKLYDRMGCDYLGLDLVRNWQFQHSSALGLGGEMNPLKLLRRRSSLVVDDRALQQARKGMSRDEADLPKPPPTMFEEPDAASLLDSFGL